MTAQYTRPEIIGEVSPAVTDTIASSNNDRPSDIRPMQSMAWPCPSFPSAAKSWSPKRRASESAWPNLSSADSGSPAPIAIRPAGNSRYPHSTVSSSCSSTIRFARPNQPPPCAISPRWTRAKPSQNAHRTARSSSPRSLQPSWARDQASVLSASCRGQVGRSRPALEIGGLQRLVSVRLHETT